MKKPVKKGGAMPPLYREVDVCDLDRVRGGTVIVSDPGPVDQGPKVTGGTRPTSS